MTMSDDASETRTLRPPPNALRVEAWRDLPKDRTQQRYLVTPLMGQPHKITVRKNNRRILDAARSAPILCASPVRISDVVHVLKRDYGLNFETRMYENDAATDRSKFGVYFLLDEVTPISEVAA